MVVKVRVYGKRQWVTRPPTNVRIDYPLKYAKIKISNPNSYDLNNYQVRIDLTDVINTYGKGKIVIYDDSGNIIPFAYEKSNGEVTPNYSEWDTNCVWVKVPNIPANGEITLNLAYCLSDYATTGDNIFDFYDDFTTNTLGTVWSEYPYAGGSDPVISNGVLDMNNVDDYVYADIGNWKDVVVELKTKPINVSSGYGVGHFLFYSDLGITDTWAENQFIWSAYRWDSTEGKVFSWYDTDYHNVGSWDFNVWYILKYEIHKDTGTFKWFIYDTNWNLLYQELNGNARDNTGTYIKYIAFIGNSSVSDDHFQVDWVRVRKYADQEPTVSLIL